MQDLNKHQIVLLCILISFVVSIATGIMTTSLLMEAPVQLTQTVNRVVERTIETVTPASTPINPNPPSKQVETVVVNVDDSVTSAIAKNIPTIVRIHERSTDQSIDNLYGIGVVVSKDGIIVTDKRTLSNAISYVAVMSDNTEIPLEPIVADKKFQVTFFKAKPIKDYSFTIAKFMTTDVKLGQTVVAIGGDTTNSITVGRVTSLNTKDLLTLGTSTPAKYVASISTDVLPADGVSGAPIISLSGDIVGMSLSSFSSAKTYFPASLIKQEFDTIVVAQ